MSTRGHNIAGRGPPETSSERSEGRRIRWEGPKCSKPRHAAQRTKSRAHPRLPPAHHPPNTDIHILLRFSSKDVVERPLLERPVEHILHAIPPREAPLRDKVPFYASVEPPSSQHRLSRKSAAHLTEPKSALGVPVSGHLQRKCPKNALGVLQTGHLQHPAGRRPATSDSART